MKHFTNFSIPLSRLILKTFLSLLLVGCMALGNSVYATNYTPTTFTDPDYTAINNSTGAITAGVGIGLISLRSALQAADNNGPGPHIITLLGGTYTVSGGASIGTYIIFGSNAQNITINGVAGSTMIDMATGTFQDRIFAINLATGGTTPNVQVTINNVMFTNGHLNNDPYGGGAIEFVSGSNASSLNLNYCSFVNNTIDPAAGTTGGAVNFSGTGTLSVDNCNFTNNTNDNSDGGALYYFFENTNGNIGSVTVTNSIFNNNSATAVGGGSGGAIGIVSQGRAGANNQLFTVNISTNSFTGNSAPAGSGGAIIVDNGSSAYSININYNRFNNNSDGGSATGASSALGMNANGLGGGSVIATNNWWGCNTNPSTAGACNRAAIVGGPSVGTLTSNPWLELKATASTSPICPSAFGLGNTSTVTASFLNNSAGTAIPLANLVTLTGTAPFSPLPVSFVNPVLGTLSSAQANIQASGTATVLFTSTGTPGAGSVNAVVDNVPNNDGVAKATITINAPAAISVPPGNQSVCLGSTSTFTVTATGTAPISYQWYLGATPLANGPTGNGSTYAGVTTNTLTITGTTLADATSNYNVQVSNSCANVTSANVSLTVYPPPTVNAPTVTQPTCAVPSGTIVVNASGAATLEYSINNGINWFSSATFSGLAAGNYTILVRIQAVPTCTTPFAGNPVVINAIPVAPTMNAPTVTQPTCAVPTGSIVINASGAGTLEYTVDNGTSWQMTNSYSGLTPGSYTIGARLQAQTTCFSFYSGNPVILVAATGCCVAPTITCPANIVRSTGAVSLANYPLISNLADANSNFGNVILQGSPTPPTPPSPGNPLCENGIYIIPSGGGGQNIQTPVISTLNQNAFELDIDFRLSGYASSFGAPVIMGGNSFRWIGIYVSNLGNVGIKWNNSNTVFSSTTVNLNQWYSAVLIFAGNIARLYINGNLVQTQVTGPLVTANNFNFTTNDFSIGRALNGCIRNLQVFNINSIPACSANVSYSASVSGNCSPVVTYTPASGSLFLIGNNTVKAKATNTASQSDSCFFNIWIVDNVKPTFTRPADITIYTNANCGYDASVLVTGDVTDEADNCYAGEQATHTDVVTSGPCAGSKVIKRTWSLVDTHGNIADDQVQTITVTDNIPPLLTGTLPGGASGNLCKSAATPAPSNSTIATKYADNCSAVTATLIGSSVTGTDCSWTATYTYSVVDACNNAAPNAVVVFTGGDTEAPHLVGTLPGGASGNLCKSAAPPAPDVETIAGFYADNCSAATATLISSSVTGTDCSWTATYTYSIVDACNNAAANAVVLFTGGDTEAPHLVGTLPGGTSGNLCKSAATPAPSAATIASKYADNCSAVIATLISSSITGSDCSWTATYIYSIKDACNNATANAVVLFTGGDTEAPHIVGTLPGGTSGNLCKSAATPAPSAATIASKYADNCSAVIATLISSSITGSDCSWTATYIYSIKDACNNAAANAMVVFTGGDIEAPHLVGTLPGGASGNLCKSAATPAPSAATIASKYADNCSAVTATLLSSNVTGSNCSWTASYIYSIKDACGNAAANAVIVFTGGDTQPPTFTRPADITIPFTSACGYNAAVSNTGTATNISDNCSTGLLATFTDLISQCGYNTIIKRTWRLVDYCGNAAAPQVQTITVSDNNTNFIIYATKEADFGEDNLINGDVGVTATNGKAQFDEGDVLNPYKVVAKNITVNTPAQVSNRFYTPATGGPNPAFLAFNGTGGSGNYTATVNGTVNGNYKNLTIKAGVTATITGNDFGNISIEENAKVTFTASLINMVELDVQEGENNGTTDVIFSSCTGLKVKNMVSIEENCRFNVNGPKLIVYMGNGNSAEFDVIGGNTQVTANIMIPKGNLNVDGDDEENTITVMTGWFIIENLESGESVTWNKYSCSSTAAPFAEGNYYVRKAPVVKDPPVQPLIPVLPERFVVSVYPNPTPGDFNVQVISNSNEPIFVKIMNVNGNVIQASTTYTKSGLMTLAGKYRGGTYFVEVSQGNNKQVVKLIRMN